MREFGVYWARIEGNTVFGDIDTADLYVVRVCEISFFLSEILMNFAYPYILSVQSLLLGTLVTQR